jgi:formamidopyrimidine-DNA glycosylase
MPELPEVEVTRCGIVPYIENNVIARVAVHTVNLRWPIPTELNVLLSNQTVSTVSRRGKYLVLHCSTGSIIIHLGMTGHLRVLPDSAKPSKHDHLDFFFNSGILLRLNDTRRFGTVLWTEADPQQHKLLTNIGPEPLSELFNDAYLYQKSRGRKIAIKHFIENSNIIAGIGNIYANEALFHAGIRPSTPTGKLTNSSCHKLVNAIKDVLIVSINSGGTMFDFRNGSEKLGCFHQNMMVYNRGGKPCQFCGKIIKQKILGKRSIYYCQTCQR